MDYPKDELRDAMYDLLTVQFHDVLPGSAVKPAEDAALQMLAHGAEILSRVRTRAFFAMSGGQKPHAPDAIPILIYNPFPFPVEDDFACEMMLWDQNWAEEFSVPQVMRDGEPLPTQCEKENSTINLDWRKRPVFHATLQPMRMNRFDCAFTKAPKRPAPETREDAEYMYLENDRVCVRISKTTGYIDSYVLDGREMLSAPCALHVVADDSDPWGMCVHAFPDRIGTFRSLTAQETAEWFGLSRPLEAVHCIESGAVRTTVEAALGYGRSRAVLRYTLSHTDASLRVDIHVHWCETQKMLKFAVPAALEDARCFGEVAYGEEAFSQDGLEHCAQKYVRLENSETALSVLTDSTYGFSAEDSTLYMTLLRSAAYCAHPIGDRERIPQDRRTPHMEQGERDCAFVLFGGDADTVRRQTPRRAQRMNACFPALSFYPPQGGKPDATVFTLDGDDMLQTAFKRAEDGDGYVLRLFNPFDRTARTVLRSDVFSLCEPLELTPFEIRTLRLQSGKCTETDLMEKEV
jgi:alpha-mannosidase